MIENIPFVSFKYTQEAFGSNVKEFHVSFIATGNQQFPVRSERGPVRRIFEASELSVDLVRDGVVDFHFVGTRYSYEIRLNRHNIDIVDRSELFDSNWELLSNKFSKDFLSK